MSDEGRRENRTRTHAKVLVLEGAIPGWLRDLSPRGCKVSLLKPAAAGERVSLRILPAEESDIPPFTVEMEVRWSREDTVFRQLGGLLHPPDDPGARECLGRLYAYYEETEV
jgi:hypothetical protein